MSLNNEIITLQFGQYSNFIGSHWWNLQESSFVYYANDVPEINYDILFREGLNHRKEVTFTPRLLVTDLKSNLGSLPLRNDLYEETAVPDLQDDVLLWPSDKVEVQRAPEYEKNEFLDDVINRKTKMVFENPASTTNLTHMYDLDKKVHFWSDYLGVQFHPKTLTAVNEYWCGDSNNFFSTFTQGTEMWKTGLFYDEWSDKCRVFAEECDALQGFQILFDCVDGFSGLACSALTHLQDEFASKSVLTFPVVASWYPAASNDVESIRTVNSVLTFSELTELSSAFVPLCTGMDGWKKPGPSRKFSHLQYKEELLYHSSALIAAFLDTISIGYRRRNNVTRLSTFLLNLTPWGRKLLTATMRLPFPVYPDLSILDSLESLENPFWTTISPKANTTIDTSIYQQITVRGLTSFNLLPNYEKRFANPAYKCETVEELFLMYLNCCSSREVKANVNSFKMALKIPPSFPNIFDENVTRIGCISPSQFPFKFAVTEAPSFAGLHNCSSVCLLLTHLHDSVSKTNVRQLYQFPASRLEILDYTESIENLLTLNDCYR